MKTFAKNKGFTLVELMIVIAIIGILATVLYPSFSGVFEGARDSTRKQTIATLKSSLIRYAGDYSKYPDKTENNCVDGLDLSDYDTKKMKDPKGNYGVKDCETKGGLGYKPIKINQKDGDKSIGSAFIISTKMEQWGNMNFDGSNWEKINNLKEIKILEKSETTNFKNEGDKTYYVEHS